MPGGVGLQLPAGIRVHVIPVAAVQAVAAQQPLGAFLQTAAPAPDCQILPSHAVPIAPLVENFFICAIGQQVLPSTLEIEQELLGHEIGDHF